MAGRRGAAGILAVAAMMLLTGLGCTATTTQDRAAALLAADRGFGAASDRPMLDQLGAAFTDRAMMPDGPRGLAEGRSALIAALGRDTLAPRSRVRWAPVRGGVSGDGTHGFTMGFMAITRPDGSEIPQRYLAYWVREAAGWRMLMFRRAPRLEGDVETRVAASLNAPKADALDAETLQARERELAAAEAAFSEASQRIGLGEAFAEYGHPQAWHLNGPPSQDFVRGRDAVVASVSGGVEPGTSPFVWAATVTVVAPSGDFGVNAGIIHLVTAQDQPGFPFFTVWIRDADGEWRYIAE